LNQRNAVVKVAQAYEVARLNNKQQGYSLMVMARQPAAMSFTQMGWLP
jgi:hypothetical protein